MSLEYFFLLATKDFRSLETQPLLYAGSGSMSGPSSGGEQQQQSCAGERDGRRDGGPGENIVTRDADH